ncbi:MAG: selenium metabolism-associated LysR family transcriptional regulator [Nitrospiraceae bacterium]|nr:selenium metabolism-associated LysR family transcriptional regulator [Nitrospiraceae bacterium]
MMDIHQLRVFCSVFKNRSFSRASEELFLSQPTISDHIKSLEETLGSRLFDRLGRSIAPTRESILLYPRAVELIEKLEAIKSDIKLSRNDPNGELHIGASTIPGTYFIPAATREFKELYPDVSFRLTVKDSKSIINMVAEHELPLGIAGAKLERKSLSFTPLMNDELVLAARQDILNKPVITPEELTGLPFLIREEGSGTRKTAEQFFMEKGVQPSKLKVVASLGSNSAIKEAVKSGLGVSVLSRACLSGELEKGILKEVKIKGLRMTRNFYVVTHKRRSLPRVLELFIEHLRALKSRWL